MLNRSSVLIVLQFSVSLSCVNAYKPTIKENKIEVVQILGIILHNFNVTQFSPSPLKTYTISIGPGPLAITRLLGFPGCNRVICGSPGLNFIKLFSKCKLYGILAGNQFLLSKIWLSRGGFHKELGLVLSRVRTS